VDGDLCRDDGDCCGAAGTGLPGDGNVTCDKSSGGPVGICRNPTGCDPQGDVCHYKNYACSISSARNDCCSAVGNSGRCIPDSKGVLRCNGFDASVCVGLAANDACSLCQLDSFGVPRCNGLGTCRKAGETCSSEADCCDELPCVPNKTGELVCGSTVCVKSGGSCTIDGDCCPGSTCIRPIGSTVGTCSVPPGSGGGTGAGGTAGAGGVANSGGAKNTGGVVGGGGTGAGGTGAGGTGAGGKASGGTTGGGGTAQGGSGGTPCAAYGQICSVNSDCCNQVPCTSGKCVFPIP